MKRDERRRIIVEGLAAQAVTLAELGAGEANVHGNSITGLHRLGVTDPPAVRRDAAAVMLTAREWVERLADHLDSDRT